MDYSAPGSSVHGFLQARILEWVAIPFSRGSSRPTNQTLISCIGRHVLNLLSHQGSPINCARHLCKKWLIVYCTESWHLKNNDMSFLNHLYMHMLGSIWLFVTPWTITCQAPLSMEFPGKNTGMGCHFLLWGIFLTQGSNSHLSHLLHWQADSLPLCHLGSPLNHLLCTRCDARPLNSTNAY